MGKTSVRITKKQGLKWRPTIEKSNSKKDKKNTYNCKICRIKITYARTQRCDSMCNRCFGE